MGQFSSKNIGNPSQYDHMTDEEIHEELEKRRPSYYPPITKYKSAKLTERQLYARIKKLEGEDPSDKSGISINSTGRRQSAMRAKVKFLF